MSTVEKAGFDFTCHEISADKTPVDGSLVDVAPAVDSLVVETMLDAPLDAPALAGNIPDRGTSTYDRAAIKETNDDFDTSDLIAPRSLANSLKDRQNRLMAELLTRFTNLVKLATTPEEDGATLETQGALSLLMDVETTALVKAIEDLHRLTRDLKELWLAGPLRGIGEGEGDGDMAVNAAKAQKLVDDITKKVRELNGGEDVQCE